MSLLTSGVAGLMAACVDDQTLEADKPAVPGAPYAVGSTTFFIHDDSRPFDAVGGIDTGVRTLVTELWYPVAHSAIGPQSLQATYADYVFGNREVHRTLMTRTTFFHLTADTVREGVTQAEIDAAIDALFEQTRGSYVDAPVAGPGPWPVVVMSHGDAGSRYNMATVSEYLAAHGYMVIAPEHTGSSAYSMIGADPALASEGGDPGFREDMVDVLAALDTHGVYGSIERYGQTYAPEANSFGPAGIADLDRALLERVNDLRAALGALAQMNREGPFAGVIDLEHVGVTGRSFGGATTLAALGLESRFDAGFAVVPPPLPDLRPLLPPAMLAADTESVLLAAEGGLPASEVHKPTFILAGAEDALILSVSAALAEAGAAAQPSVSNPYPSLQSAVDGSDVEVAYALVDDTNHGSFGVAGPYWWPDLKPNQLPRFFAPETSYTLMPPAEAHSIQREMALAFFDHHLKGSDAGLRTLRANPWAERGVRLQLRGYAQ